jgi:hypothetical protein
MRHQGGCGSKEHGQRSWIDLPQATYFLEGSSRHRRFPKTVPEVQAQVLEASRVGLTVTATSVAIAAEFEAAAAVARTGRFVSSKSQEVRSRSGRRSRRRKGNFGIP